MSLKLIFIHLVYLQDKVCTKKMLFNFFLLFQLKKKKLSEVMVQCNLPFDKTNIEMDMENDVLESIHCDIAIKDEIASDIDEIAHDNVFAELEGLELLQSENNSQDFLNFVADNIEQIGQPDVSDVAFIKNILAMSPDQNDDEKENSNMSHTDYESPMRHCDITNESPMRQCDIANNSTILQLDGSDELDEGPPPNKVRKIEIPDHDSPRKDFSIAGLLSPPEPHHNPHPQVSNHASQQPQSLQMSLQQTQMSNATMAGVKIPTMSGMGLPRPPGQPNPMPGQIMSYSNLPTSAQPSVFIQHLSTPEMATSFAENFRQTTGRPLQYVTSVNNFQELASFPTFQQHTLHLNSPMLQPIGTSFQSYLAPQFSYISPQGILVSPQTGYINFGASTSGQMMFNPPTYSAYPSVATSATQFLQPHPPPAVSTARMYQQTPIMLAPSTSSGYAQATQSGSGLSRLPSSSAVSATPKKVARVQPQPWSQKSDQSKSSSLQQQQQQQQGPRRLDPIKALSNMASHPMMQANKSPDLSPSR